MRLEGQAHSFWTHFLPSRDPPAPEPSACRSLAPWSQAAGCLHLSHFFFFQSAIWPWKVEVVGEVSYLPV